MSTTDSIIGRTETLGLSTTLAVQISMNSPSLRSIMTKLEQLTEVVSDLKICVDGNGRHTGESSTTSCPPATPPFASLQSSGAIPLFSYSPPSTLSLPLNLAVSQQPPPQSFTQTSWGPHPSSAIPLSTPMHFSDAVSTAVGTFRPSPQFAPSWQPERQQVGGYERTSLRQPQMVNSASCWGPLGMRPQFGSLPQEPHATRVKMDPPRFDGTEVNNWIRSVQFYFDHLAPLKHNVCTTSSCFSSHPSLIGYGTTAPATSMLRGMSS